MGLLPEGAAAPAPSLEWAIRLRSGPWSSDGSLAVADLTGDGNLDVVTANRENNDVAVLPNELAQVELLDDEALGTIIDDPPLFADGFESGDTSAWSVVVE